MRHWVPIYFDLTDETLGVNLFLWIFQIRH
ncbi:hypothetical protein F383_10416 [Gossypium arboreum]|uniref:Uncharacterized protein n=1 Tax=Gossypium arboreum TaxID=29729 RepID=A0A0B0PDV2_GOSAR|nr:hypothetical protein F383_10416 [Gossypium arboreum]